MFPLLLAAVLTALLGLAHSWLGERYLVSRLMRRKDLPKLFGSDRFTRHTIRFAWHLTTVAWFGFAALLWLLAHRSPSESLEPSLVREILARTFAFGALIAFVGSRGRHLSWLVLLAIALLIWYADPIQAWIGSLP